MQALEMLSGTVISNMFGVSSNTRAEHLVLQPQLKTVGNTSASTPKMQDFTEGQKIGTLASTSTVQDFTGGQRIGTYYLNIIPGLGSFIVMKDVRGGLTQVCLTTGGIICIIGSIASESEGLLLLGVGSMLSSPIYGIYRSGTYTKPNSSAEQDDFTGKQRFATFLLNGIIPGLGSATVMKDWTGTGVYIGLRITGIYILNETPNALPTAILLSLFSEVWNICRSITYTKPGSKQPPLMTHTQGLNFAVLPDKNGNLRAIAMYNIGF